MNRTFLPLALCFAASLLLSCASGPVKVAATPNPDDYKSGPRPGTAVVAGEAFGRTKGGEVKPAAGLAIYLDPATPYSTEVFKTVLKHGPFDEEKVSDTVVFDPAMLKARRQTTGDSSGRFRFVRVAAGDYFVSCYVRWMKPNGWYTGGWKVKRIRVRDGQEITNLVL